MPSPMNVLIPAPGQTLKSAMEVEHPTGLAIKRLRACAESLEGLAEATAMRLSSVSADRTPAEPSGRPVRVSGPQAGTSPLVTELSALAGRLDLVAARIQDALERLEV